jgi:hypothetical protein
MSSFSKDLRSTQNDGVNWRQHGGGDRGPLQQAHGIPKAEVTALEEQVVELHLAVYDQHDEFGVLHKATTSKLKHFAKGLGDPLLYNAPSP